MRQFISEYNDLQEENNNILRHTKVSALTNEEYTNFLCLMGDEDIKVRKAGINLFHSLLSVPGFQEYLLKTSDGRKAVLSTFLLAKYRDDLMEKVQMGPFTDKVDRGLPLRKTVYECIYSITDKFPAIFFQHQDNLFINYLETITNGLEDPTDKTNTINNLCLNTIMILASVKECSSNLDNQHAMILLNKVQGVMANACQKIKQVVTEKQEQTKNNNPSMVKDIVDRECRAVWLPSLQIVLNLRSLGFCDTSGVLNEYKNQRHLLNSKFVSEVKRFEVGASL